MSDDDIPIFIFDPDEDPSADLPMPKVGDRFMLGDFEVVVTAVQPREDDSQTFTIEVPPQEEP